MFLNPVKPQHDFLPTANSYPEQAVLRPCTDEALETSLTFDETFQIDARPDILPVLEAQTSDFVMNSDMPFNGLTGEPPVVHEKDTNPSQTSEHTEEKKECENVDMAEQFPQDMSYDQEQTAAPSQSEEFVCQSSSDDDDDDDAFSDDEMESRHPPRLRKAMSAPDDGFGEENSFLLEQPSVVSFKSAPNRGCDNDTGFVTPVLKRTGTWDGVVSNTDTDALAAVNSIISNTSAVVGDAAGFLADLTSGESSRGAVTKAVSSESVYDNTCSLVGSRRMSNSVYHHVHHPLCHSDGNFKAAVQDVLSHLSLSPRKAQFKNHAAFLPESENKEFLRNYFYCTKMDESSSQLNANTAKLLEEWDNSYSVTGGGISCAEPCNNVHDTQCHAFGVDAMCSGLTYYFSPLTTGGDHSNSSSNSSRRRDILSQSTGNQGEGMSNLLNGGKNRTRSASASGPAAAAAVTAAHQHHIDLQSTGNRESSWLGMFQRAASNGFSFHAGDGSNELERSKHPFTPPCLTRRVLHRTHSR
jgi:hypothetical protein